MPAAWTCAAAAASIAAITERYGLPLDPRRGWGTYRSAQRQRVEIVKVLYRGARILILDEPTAVLVPQEVDELLRNLRVLRRRGVHHPVHLPQARRGAAVADVITVMRAGTTVATMRPGATDARRLAEPMVGTALPEPARDALPPREAIALEVRGVHPPRPDAPRVARTTVNLRDPRGGRSWALAGVEGNGQAELVEVILGLAMPVRRDRRAGRRGHHWPLDP